MATRAPQQQLRQGGFTLVEILMAITILGIVAGVVSVFIVSPVKAYFSTANRAQLTDAADGALRRITRDVGSALPNSLRSTSGGSNACVEFIPTLAGGRYRYQTGSSGNGDILNFAAADSSFDVLGQVNLGSLPSGGKKVVIYNLGIEGADAYAGNNTATIATASTTAVTLSSARQFPFEAPGNAFQVIPDYSVVYSCVGSSLLRSTQSLSASPMASCPSTGTPIATNVSGCSFYYLPTVNARTGILSISLGLALDNETVTLFDQVMVNNVP